MSNCYRYILYIHLHLSISMNYFLTHANPLIGEAVRRALDNELPSVVSLATVPATNESDHYCTGTLITEQHVLTCAHCVKSIDRSERSWKKRSNILVTVGSTDSTRGTKYQVLGWMTYDKWASDHHIAIEFPHLHHDIAVVKLMKKVENIKPARLSQLKHIDISDKTVVAAGWGHVTVIGDEPRFLQRTDLYVLDEETCSENLMDFGMSDDIPNHFCTIGKSAPTSLGCGDSGGPIFINGDELVGISVAVCHYYAHPSQLNLHLRLEIYRKFIETVVDFRTNEIQRQEYNIYNVADNSSMCTSSKYFDLIQ